MRIQIKGGAWKNSEDEVLKAAVMKYGLNNWSRVSSLLVRKSAKQCKARWYEWLNPFVKKTEWSREEEEKLLHLAKLFPTQWRTIGPLIGRTAHQCLQHYERLLDQAQGREEDDELDLRKIRPGEIDPAPETKPSRADAVDMDDDEKEMLAEARARLANTRGKKAKRKAREKMLEQTRRIASLQKRRELKSAGISVGALRLHNSIMDYATEVPFEQQPPKGFYPPDEDKRAPLSLRNVQQLEGRRRDDEMRKFRKDDIRKLKRLQNEDVPAALAIFDKYENKTVLKNRLTLPEPTMTDEELVQIVKMGADVQMFGETVANSVVARTPMTSSVMEEARLAYATNRLQTPLEGEMNVPESRFAVPQTPSSFHTPNPLRKLIGQTQLSFLHGGFGGITPSRFSDSTPMRDDVSEADPIGSRARLDMARLHVKATISNLPVPVSEVEISIPDATEALKQIQDEQEVDMDDLKKEKMAIDAIERENISKCETSVIRRGLPRPLVYNNIVFVNDFDLKNTTNEDERTALELINLEFRKLIAWDSVNHPQPGGKPCVKPPPQEFVDFSGICEADELIECETERVMELLNAKGLIDSEEERTLANTYVGFSVLQKRYCLAEKQSVAERTAALKLLCTEHEHHLEHLAKRNKILENRYNISTGGYRQREVAVLKEIEDACDAIVNFSNDLEVFSQLTERENKAAEMRIRMQLSLLQREKRLSHELQSIYSEIIGQQLGKND